MFLIKNLIKAYPGFRLDVSEWKLPGEGITALTGPSGSGKSTVVRILLGLESCPGLSWMAGEEDLAKLSIPERRLGVVFQDYALFPHLTAYENIEFAAKARQIRDSELKAKLKEWSEILSLPKFIDRKAGLLSGGEQQRVALVRALVGHPRFLFLDEPFSALDADLRAESRKLVRSLVEREKIPTLLISHDRADVKDLASREFRLEGGKIRQV